MNNKFKYKTGSDSVTLNKLISLHKKPYKTIEKNESAKTEKQELKLLQKLKDKKSHGDKNLSMPIDELVEEHERLTKVLKSKSKSDDKEELEEQTKELKKYKKLDDKEDEREIESEGREPIYSPKKKDGTRDLLYFNPNDPTHKQGGVDVTIVKKSKYNKLKSGTKDIVVPEGSAIVTAKDGKNKESLKAYKRGDYKKLNKIIDQMPEDKVSKKINGSSALGLVNTSSKLKKGIGAVDSGFSLNQRSGGSGLEAPITESINEQITPKTKSNKGFLTDGLNSLLTSAPAAYNIGKGLFGKVEKTERNFYTPETMKYRDMSDPMRRAAQEEYQATKSELRRGAPNASTYIANAQMAANQRYKRTADIQNAELQRQTDIQNQNAMINNQARLTNLNLRNQYNDLDLQNKARKEDFLGKGLEQVSSLAQMSTLNKNRAKSDDALLKLLGSRNFTYNRDSGNIETREKGSKNLKTKYKKKK